MLYTKNDPVGLDKPIQRLQEYLHGKLLALWGIDTSQYQAYGRCYRNQTEDGYIPEVYIGGNEYKEVYVDDTVTALSFFGLSGHTKVDGAGYADVHLIFFVNVQALKNVPHRGDEEVRRDVQRLIAPGKFGFSLNGVELWIDNVFREYSGARRSQGIKFRDMHPFHCFRLNMKLSYNIFNC
ncbi:hypothetical protein [Chitinophaga sp. YIM B06452]|uniref:hypothetical protein n=1 Tax=Chitinophaga sp. YIM B06452 TaxID=3082158 RepID=UPI0031FEC7FE